MMEIKAKFDLRDVLRKHLKDDAPIDPGKPGEEMRVRFDGMRITMPDRHGGVWSAPKPGQIEFLWQGQRVAVLDLPHVGPGDVFDLHNLRGSMGLKIDFS